MLNSAKHDLKKSGIAVVDAENNLMFSVKDASTIYPDFKEQAALVIPYPDPWVDDIIEFERNGKMLPFCRVRYYPKKTNNSAQGFKKKKQLRYSQPSNSGVHPYFPVADGIDWVAIADDPEIPIMITEGEKKALAACLAGVPTIGLGGVYNFAHDGELLPALDRIEWSQRTVYICYDSDAGNNSKIQVAEGRLATELSMKRNASIFLVRLPELPGGSKMGVDDYLVREGDDALFDLLEKAPQMRKVDQEVLRLNAEVAWIDKEGLLLNLETDNWMKKSDFVKGSEFSSRTITVATERGAGVKVISVANAWLTHPHARRYADTIFRPGTDDKAIPIASGGVAYNRFRGLAEEEGDVQPFFDLYDWLMSLTDEFDEDLVWKIIAYKMQNQEIKSGLGFILLGSSGGGKTMFCDIIAQMVAPYNKTMGTDEMGADFNGWLETSLVVVMNESESRKMKDSMSKLKTYVSDKPQSMNEKYRAHREVQNYSLFLFNSNERSAGAFADDDRRMIVIDCPNLHPDGPKFYDPIGKWLESGGPKKLLHFFKNYDLEGWEPPRWAPQTREKRNAYLNSLTPVQKLGHDIRRSKENIVTLWLSQALNWASSELVGSAPYQVAMSQEIKFNLTNIEIRPFYTPHELSLMFPAIASTLSYGKVREMAPANLLAQELAQVGIKYLKCKENLDGFLYQGQIKQFLVIADHEKYINPISQEKFDRMMGSFPRFKDWKAQNKRKQVKRKRKSIS